MVDHDIVHSGIGTAAALADSGLLRLSGNLSHYELLDARKHIFHLDDHPKDTDQLVSRPMEFMRTARHDIHTLNIDLHIVSLHATRPIAHA